MEVIKFGKYCAFSFKPLAVARCASLHLVKVRVFIFIHLYRTASLFEDSLMNMASVRYEYQRLELGA